jgi:nicotinamide mononucleotide adenylyltransferase/GTPase SAR1 family protein
MMSTVAKGRAFEEEVERILRLKGYTVTRNNLISGTQIDLHAAKNDPLENISFVVECADREATIGVDLVKEKASVLLSLRDAKSLYRLLFVSKSGFTAEAKAFASTQPNLILLTLTELEGLLVDLMPYVTSYVHNYKRSLGMFKDANLANNYVNLSARDEKGTLILSIDQHVRQWLKTDSNNLLFLLGEYGAGKTSFCRHLVYELIHEKYIERGDNKFTPILINLRDLRGRLDLKKVVTDTLATTYGVDLPSFAAFERLCSTGNVFLVFDGFDEMSDRGDLQTLIDSFNQIYLVAALDAKVLLTCRSNFFRSHADLIELLKHFSITIPVDDQNQLLELSLKDHGQVLYLEKLNGQQIREFVEKRFGNDTDDILASIQRIHDLSDLSTRPVLLDMIVSTLPELQRTKRGINSSALYEHYTGRWTIRDQWRVTIPLKIRQAFCEELAWAMHCVDTMEIPFTLLEKAMVSALSNMTASSEQLVKFKNDIQTCSFLVRIGDKDEFRFAHKSFVEFFVARKLVADLYARRRIAKPEIKAPLPVLNKNILLSDEVLPIGGIKVSGKAMMLDYLRSAINDRFRSMPTFLSMQEAEFATIWPAISSDTSVRSYFESEIRAVFSKMWLPHFSEDITISEEIATFAIEHLSNMETSLKKFISQITDQQSLNVFCDIVRLARSAEWVQQNAEVLKGYVLEGDKENLKIACSAALAKYPGLIDLDFLRSAHGKMSAEGWSYVLFELANTGANYEKVLATLIRDEKLRPVDQVICMYGVSENFPSDVASEKMTTLITELLKSPVEKERVLALKVCNALPANKRLAVVAEAFKEADSKVFKKALMELLEEFADPNSWKTVRTLSAQESDPEIRESLRATEKLLRDTNSKRQSRAAWNRVTDSRAIRDSIWRWRK